MTAAQIVHIGYLDDFFFAAPPITERQFVMAGENDGGTQEAAQQQAAVQRKRTRPTASGESGFERRKELRTAVIHVK